MTTNERRFMVQVGHLTKQTKTLREAYVAAGQLSGDVPAETKVTFYHDGYPCGHGRTTPFGWTEN